VRELSERHRSRGGVTLHRAAWQPDGDARAIAVVSHGLAEHGGRYRELALRLLALGAEVHVQDHRGHGRSGGSRAYVESFDSVVDELVELIESRRAAARGRPLWLIGHSFGGTVAFAAALRRPELVDALVLSAPALGVDPELPWLQVRLGRLLSAIAPRAGLLRLEAGAVSRDPAVVAAYRADPLNFRGAVPARTLVELVDAIGRLAPRAPELRTPTLVLHGTADRLVPLRFNTPVYARLGPADLTVREYEGFYHEVLNEPGRALVYADLEAWLAAR